MSISRLKPDEAPVHTLTVPLAFDEDGVTQVFDLGSIRLVFLQATLTAFFTDGEPAGPNDMRVELDNIETSRDGVTYAPVAASLFILNDSPYATEPPVLPAVVVQAAFITARYVRYSAAVVSGQPGVFAPTASATVYVEYV